MAAAEAVAHCRRPYGVPARLLRRAIVRVREVGACGATRGLTRVVDDTRRDTLTRALAALAIGEIGCHGRGRRSHDGLARVTVASLESATATDQPAGLRQAAVRALGRAEVTGSVPVLLALRSSDPDAVVSFLAAQALTRITGEDHFDAVFRDSLVDRYIDASSTYRILEVTP